MAKRTKTEDHSDEVEFELVKSEPPPPPSRGTIPRDDAPRGDIPRIEVPTDKVYSCYCQQCGTGCQNKTIGGVVCPNAESSSARVCYCQICGTSAATDRSGIKCPYGEVVTKK